MSRIFKDRLSTGVTPVADAFIDNYMAAANGEYVKVYLYILRHQNQEDLTLEQIADALNHTEADVKRAINYWQKAGVLENVQDNTLEGISAEQNRTSWSIDISGPHSYQHITLHTMFKDKCLNFIKRWDIVGWCSQFFDPGSNISRAYT